ncbi:hypothetical protein Taro_019615 [Colocasia esculenta]|uniref:Uncharacterized protein n=1 Tax=Colocasia esculenta TaxID=4460 RepID=A0A843UXA0_COLES|nr:hypothetical protein [Colocasia esculenta]
MDCGLAEACRHFRRECHQEFLKIDNTLQCMLDILNKPRIQEEHYEATPTLIEEYYAEVESERSAINDNPFVAKDEPAAEEVVGDMVEESKDVLVTPILHDSWDHSLIIEAGFDLLSDQLFEISISLCRHFPTVDTLCKALEFCPFI